MAARQACICRKTLGDDGVPPPRTNINGILPCEAGHKGLTTTTATNYSEMGSTANTFFLECEKWGGDGVGWWFKKYTHAFKERVSL